MTSKIIDARSLACPGPVLETRKVLKKSNATSIIVLVDNDAAAENVARMARSLDCEVSLEDIDNGEFKILLKREDNFTQSDDADESVLQQPLLETCGVEKKISILLSSDTIGDGVSINNSTNDENDLGRLLMVAFVKTLKEIIPRPKTLLLMNSGVKLATGNSELIDAILNLEKNGLEILVCGTCLDFFNIKNELKVGNISNMFDIISVMADSDTVIRP